jgi:hypothetical protein
MWLIYNRGQACTNYAIIDDNGDMLPIQTENFFQTEFKTGLTREIADKIIRKLGFIPDKSAISTKTEGN